MRSVHYESGPPPQKAAAAAVVMELELEEVDDDCEVTVSDCATPESGSMSAEHSGRGSSQETPTPPDDEIGSSGDSVTPQGEGSSSDASSYPPSEGGRGPADREVPLTLLGTTLTPEVLKVLLKPNGSELDDISAELHMSARQGPSASRTLLHALSKESLDVLRAERIARRMAAASAAAAAAASAPSARVTCRSIDDGEGTGAKRKQKSRGTARDRVYLPVVIRPSHAGVQPAGSDAACISAHCVPTAVKA